MSEPDLFVVCKNCSSEVSPYVTECPYCGQRVRKRAPKIERGTGEGELPRRRRGPRAPTLPRLRRGEIPGIAPETRPYATAVLIVAALIVTVVLGTGAISTHTFGIDGPVGHQWWRIATTPFVFSNAGAEFVALVTVAIFGTHVERRFGPAAAAVTFLACGAAGAALSVALEAFPALGANGAALGLLSAWLVDDRLALRRGDDRGNDLIGVWVIAALLFLLPVGDTDTSFFAGVGGAAAGALIGALLSTVRA